MSKLKQPTEKELIQWEYEWNKDQEIMWGWDPEWSDELDMYHNLRWMNS